MLPHIVVGFQLSLNFSSVRHCRKSSSSHEAVRSPPGSCLPPGPRLPLADAWYGHGYGLRTYGGHGVYGSYGHGYGYSSLGHYGGHGYGKRSANAEAKADADAASLVLDKLSLSECHGNVLLQPRVKETQRPDLSGPHTHTQTLRDHSSAHTALWKVGCNRHF